MAEKRKRGQNFSAEEKDRLVKLLSLHKNTILNKKTDGSTNEAKNKAWIDVTNAFNASATVYRTRDSLVKVWEKLKTESKLYYQSARRSVTGTGGGPAEVKFDPILEQVCALLGRACTGIEGVQDCDAIILMEVENMPPKEIQGNTEPTVTVEKCAVEHEPADINVSILEDRENGDSTGQEMLHENYIPKTPLWSRRRPQLPQTNERTEAMSSLCTSFKNVNKKKEDIEDLKRQLLQEEIDFKRKLYELQLQAAMKEVEIKTEVLNRLKGYLGDDMAETIQLCCNEGAGFARNHTRNDCQGTLSVPPEIPPAFGSMCLLAKAQCCREYFKKESDCETGIDIATSRYSCESSKSTSKVCCNDCSRGTAAGESKGPDACVERKHGMSAEELLADDAFVTCCKRAAKDWKGDPTSRSTNSITLSTLPSLCEDYAPNELCAHHCIPVPGSYKCECNSGFMLMADGRNCKEVGKNRCKPHNPCQHKCNDNGVEVKCSCRRGYELMPDNTSCQDIDECQLDVSVCLAGTQCHNLQGSYRCISVKKNGVEKGQCPPGFARNLNNNVCDDINECLLPNPPCPSFVCENTIGGYSCGGVTGNPINLSTSPRTHVEDRCPPGFKVGLHEECEDVDECATHKHDCNPLSQFCINTHSSCYCQDKVSKHCPPGFKIDSTTNKCEDIDECEDGGVICRPDQMCVNQLGQYDCKPKVDVSKEQCPDGMRKKAGSVYCEDIDECVEGTHLCDQYQHCLNTNGSYECHCKLGYELDITTGACVDVNECATGQHECIPQAQRCDNTVGSYLCIRITSCGTGYVLHHSTGKCEDIDECGLGLDNCGPDYQCYNMRGSFRCVRRRTSSTSTTPPPEYEYEYYDSEEETEGNRTVPTNNQPKEPSTTTTLTPKPEPPTTSSTTTEKPKELEPRQEDNNVEPPPTYNNIPDIYRNEANGPYSKPKFEQPTTPPPEQPTETQQPEYIPTATEPQPTYTPKQPEVTFNRPTPPEYIPEEELPKQPEEQPPLLKPTYPLQPEEPTNESIPPEEEPKQTETTYRPTEQPKPLPPYLVNVNVGQGTATVAGERKEDGSVVVDTQQVPKNQWTEVVKPKECPFGFEADEYGSCFDIDECATNRHSCSGLTEVCRNTIGGYTCNCAPGFRRDLVTKSCEFITTSSSTTSTTTPPPQLPTSTQKTFFWGYPEYRVTVRPFRPRNLCDAGFHHNAKTGQCEDINECTNGQANCAAVEICINTDGGYRCECPPNWRLDEVRHRCVPVKNNGQFPTGYGNEPIFPSLPPKNVVYTSGTKYVDPAITQIQDRGSVFRCPAGYKLGDDNTCVDVNECLTGEAKCGPQQICANLPGGYSCNCPTGHRLVKDHECEDVNECVLAGSMPVCSQNADCVNTIGSYQCKCHIGFRSAPVNDKVCVDVDECMESRPGSLCQHRCNNVWGGYRCACHRGYRLNLDNSTCSDVDECTEFKSKIPCVGRCLNEPGSYRCACPAGYRLSEDKRSCIDIDECETGEAPCSKSSSTSLTSSDVCVNTRGSYRCQRISCPVGYQLENKHRCNKVEPVCQPGDWNCAHQPTTISYNFITFVSNLYIPESKLKLFTMRGPVWPYVKMRFELRLVNVNAPPSIKRKADINDFLLTQNNNEGLTSIVRPLEGPQSIELEMSMELYTHEQFGGTAIAKLFIYVSEYEF